MGQSQCSYHKYSWFKCSKQHRWNHDIRCQIKPGADVDNIIPKRCLPLYKRSNTRSLKLEESHNLLPVHTHTHIYNLYIIAVVLILLKMIPLFHPQRMMRCSLNV